ncbi:MAG TPA: cupin domain-containing protein [Flavobacterium sp.]|uniref:cupin domain-containing protein n=1 Tax=Flavobacterium sp. TaxID=239 RepID=UPI002CDB6E53|nr:cupin domain-containing protein [Flavobacterium sp.]HSD14014.1 cupin domain-containing protein [Flavobacterium sp.]
MKTIKLFSMSFLFGVILLSSNSLFAQDPVMVAPDIYKKVVLDNDQVRVIQIEIAPGESTPWHSHPNHVAYALTDGKIEITDKGKAPVAMDIKAGDALYIPAVTHMAKNLGLAPIKMVVTELKHPGNKKGKAPAAPAPKK